MMSPEGVTNEAAREWKALTEVADIEVRKKAAGLAKE